MRFVTTCTLIVVERIQSVDIFVIVEVSSQRRLNVIALALIQNRLLEINRLSESLIEFSVERHIRINYHLAQIYCLELVYFYRVYRLLFVQKMYIAVAAKVLEGLLAARRQVGRIDIIVVAEAEERVA